MLRRHCFFPVQLRRSCMPNRSPRSQGRPHGRLLRLSRAEIAFRTEEPVFRLPRKMFCCQFLRAYVPPVCSTVFSFAEPVFGNVFSIRFPCFFQERVYQYALGGKMHPHSRKAEFRSTAHPPYDGPLPRFFFASALSFRI